MGTESQFCKTKRVLAMGGGDNRLKCEGTDAVCAQKTSKRVK